MSARNIAALIERYLEADDGNNDGSSGSNGSGASSSLPDSSTRQQLLQLAQKTDQLQQDMASIKSNLQMSALLPLLLNQSLKVVSDTRPNNTSGPLQVNETIEVSQADPISTLLPVLLMGGLGSGGSDSSSNTLLLLLALSGKL